MNAAMGDSLPGPEIVGPSDAWRRSPEPRRKRIVPFMYALPVLASKAFPGLFDRIFGDARIQGSVEPGRARCSANARIVERRR